MRMQIARFLAVILTALTLVPSGAHLFELPNKIDLSQEQYFVVQGVYRGWALFGFVLIGAVGDNLAFSIFVRREGLAFWFALAALLLMITSLVVFFIWTFPTNQAATNWAAVPANWATLRTQWEYSHAANAIITFLALCAVTTSILIEEH